MYGAVDFYRACLQAEIKPIIGMESYMAVRAMSDRQAGVDDKRSHLLLLAESQTGYQNLIKIATAAQLEGFYYKPRVDHAFLAAHAEGLICTTGCLGGEIPRALATGDDARAHELLDWYFQVFGREHFYFELQDHGIPELEVVNRKLIELAPRYNARFVASNDVHYLDRTDAAVHDVLLCVQTGKKLDDQHRVRMHGDTFYLRTPQEMSTLFGHIPGAIENTLAIAERCNVNLESNGYHLPRFQVPQGREADDYLRHLCEHGLQKKYSEVPGAPEVRARLDYELGVIHKMGFDAYFLIVWDLCRFADERGIWRNTRGSAAGSLVAYCLDITQVDPLEHGLLFERFLNPDRISMPDIDLDIQDDRRGELLAYVTQKYGADRVAQIITFGRLRARAALRDIGRVLATPRKTVDTLAQAVTNGDGLQAAREKPAIQALCASNKQAQQLVEIALGVEGVPRNAGTHAAGIVIADRPLVEFVPLHRPTGAASEGSAVQITTQFDMETLESLGLLKVDFLGLRTLTTMAHACKLIQRRHDVVLDVQSIPTDDPAIYELLSRGDVAGLFQIESDGMRRFLMDMRPKNIGHVTAMLALYRPGPIDFIPTFIKRMQGREPVEYLHPDLESILAETYGIFVFQEQLMQAAMELAGYTGGEADSLRKVVSKKKKEALLAQRERFVQGAAANSIPVEIANAIFDHWESFARYGFNRAHAAAYAAITCKTAYLKACYPLEYMAALLAAEKHDTDKLAVYVAAARQLDIEVLPPDVRYSGFDFSIENRAIRFGLGAIKNVGEKHVNAIVADRPTGAPFTDIDDFLSHVQLRQVGKRALESLIRVGALDGLGDRAQLLASTERLLENSAAGQKAAPAGQITMFDVMDEPASVQIQLSAAEPIVPTQRRRWERELMGICISEHPLLAEMERVESLVTATSQTLGQHAEQSVTVVGAIANFRPHVTGKGQAMAFAALEDLQGQIELVIWPTVWAEVRDWLELEQLVVITGKVESVEHGRAKVLVDRLEHLGTEGLSEVAQTTVLAEPPTPPHTTDTTLELHVGTSSPNGNRVRVTVTLPPTEEATEQMQLLQSTFTAMTTFFGDDSFTIVVHENGDCVALDFEKHTTRYCDELHNELLENGFNAADIVVQPI